jgi:hypothetical protein
MRQGSGTGGDMREIRIRWLPGLHGDASDPDDYPIEGGTWFLDNQKNRSDILAVVEAGKFAAGPGTHWMEEREA